MVTIVLIGTDPGLRGHITRWLMEIAPGVFVGKINHRLRDELWQTLVQRTQNGQAILIEPARNEIGWTARTAGRDRYTPVDIDGLTFFAPPASQ